MGKNGLIPLFSPRYIQNILKDYVTERVNKEVAILIRIGETFVNDAKTHGAYKDQTGNLRSSIGYILVNNGKIINQNISGKSAEAKKHISTFVEQLKSQYKGLVLVGFAGMDYAAAVESKGYDVISGSAPTEAIMKKAFEKFLN